jgi:hypothetical protein
MILDVIRQTVMITSLVLIMMLIIEYFNVISHGNLGKNIYHSKFKQVVIASLLGLIPGCIGGFAAVSMFTHNLLNFGALAANFIASIGDESFVVLSINPLKALYLNLILLIIAIAAGLIINLFIKAPLVQSKNENHMVIHNHEMVKEKFNFELLKNNILNMSFQRAILIIGLLLFIFGALTGQFTHGEFGSGHQSVAGPIHDHDHLGVETILFLVLAFFTLFILVRVDEHFLEKHLWEHIIKKHFLRIFLWTTGALVSISLILHYVELEPLLKNNYIIVLIMALLVGVIPESGPNLIFVTLYFSGNLPFSILLANSIVQDGHSSLPLLAESKRSFLLVKTINFTIGLIFGIAGYWMGW